MDTATLLLFALALDAALGEPETLWRRVPHPAVLMGRAIDWGERRLNTGRHRKAKGMGLVAALCAGAWWLGDAIGDLPFGVLWQSLLAAVLLAQKSLVDHVGDVAQGLETSLQAGRDAVARIVGRDTAAMDRPAVSRAAIESAAENFSDGVVAPALWFLVAGLPGILVYKVVNTADSMIGYRTDAFRDFGWAAARLDDVLNWVPARITAGFLCVGMGRWPGLAALRRDAGLHRSPNAGWPEAAMAFGLDVALSGPRSYDGEMRDFPWVHERGNRQPGPRDITRAVRALWRGWAGLLGMVLVLAIA